MSYEHFDAVIVGAAALGSESAYVFQHDVGFAGSGRAVRELNVI